MAMQPLWQVRDAAGIGPDVILPIPGGVRVNFVGRGSGGVIVNTLGFLVNAGINTGVLQAIAVACRDVLLPRLIARMHQSARFDSIRVHDMLRPQQRSVEIPLTANNVGVQGGQQLPNNVAGVLSTRTDRSGRSYRGRMFLPAFGINQAQGDLILAAELLRIAEVGNAILRLPFSFNSTVPAVLSPTRGVATQILSYRADGLVDDKSRRLTQRGQLPTAATHRSPAIYVIRKDVPSWLISSIALPKRRQRSTFSARSTVSSSVTKHSTAATPKSPSSPLTETIPCRHSPNRRRS